MPFNLQEYILFRTELKRELLNFEVDNNFKMVANPWVSNRVYDEGNIVYHPVEVVGPTGGPVETLVWWRANQRTTQSIFDTNQWDLIGGVGTGDVTLQAANGFGKIRVNYTGAVGSWQTANDGLLLSTNPDSYLNLVAGAGTSLQYDTTTNSIRIINLGSTGEINHGENLSISGIDVFAGMNGTDLTFRGFDIGPLSSPALTVLLDVVNENIEYSLDEGQIGLENLNNGSPTLDLLSDVQFPTTPANNDILQYNSATSTWRNVSLSTSGAQGPQGYQGFIGATGSGATGATGIGSTGPQGFSGNDGSNSIRWNTSTTSSPLVGGTWYIQSYPLYTMASGKIEISQFAPTVGRGIIDASVWLNSIQVGDQISIYNVGNPQNFGIYRIDSKSLVGSDWKYDVTLIVANGSVDPTVQQSISFASKGFTGATGTGFTGATGTGFTGATGVNGASGPQGAPGATGSGATGATGSQGSQGSQGFAGSTGSGSYSIPSYAALSGSTGITTLWVGNWSDLDPANGGGTLTFALPNTGVGPNAFNDGDIVTLHQESSGTVNITAPPAGSLSWHDPGSGLIGTGTVTMLPGGVLHLRKAGGAGSIWNAWGDIA
jgi:hypothetical protein